MIECPTQDKKKTDKNYAQTKADDQTGMKASSLYRRTSSVEKKNQSLGILPQHEVQQISNQNRPFPINSW